MTWENMDMARAVGPDLYAETAVTVLPPQLAELADENEPAFDEIVGGIVHAFHEGFDLNDPAALKAIVDAARRRHERATNPRTYDRTEILEAAQQARADRDARSVVYYMRVGNRVKIGTTTNLDERVKNFRPEEVMATEPGGLDLERQRHGQFCHFRLTGEWFRLEGSLRDHISQLQSVGDGRRQAG